MDTKSKNLLDTWAKQIGAYQVEHNQEGKKQESLHYYVGLPATIFATVAGVVLR